MKQIGHQGVRLGIAALLDADGMPDGPVGGDQVVLLDDVVVGDHAIGYPHAGGEDPGVTLDIQRRAVQVRHGR